jgi:hypothetical protein
MSRVLLQRFSQQCLARRANPSASHLARRCNSSSAASATFDWQDPLASKSLLTEEELAISETAERYCQEQLQPRVLRECHCPSMPRPCLTNKKLLQRPTETRTTTRKSFKKWES